MANHLQFWLILIAFCVCCFGGDVIVIKYNVDEEKAPIVIGNVADDSRIESIAPSAALPNMQYQFLSVGSVEENGYVSSFSVQNNTGTLSVKSKLDRESLCLFQSTCVLLLRIGASSGTFFQQIDVEITVIDVNDNTPEFSRSSISIPISEDSNINASFPAISARDKDTGINSKLTYQLLPDSGTFALDVQESGDTTSVSVILKQNLNREVLSDYQIYILATDGGNPSNTGRLTVNIVVKDVNDNSPVFSPTEYNVTLMEDVAMDTVIVTVSATDSDEGVNSEINYEFSSLEASSSVFPFSLNSQNGEISIVRKLNFAPGRAHQIGVRAYDNGYPSKSSTATVTINVIDTNNHAPEIAISQLLDGKIPENSKQDTVLAYVAVTDRDIGPNAEVSCSIKSDGPFQIQKLSEDEARGENAFNVIVSGSLDREQQIEHVVTINCEDSGSPKKNQSSSFIVQVQDQNDNPPIFSQPVYNASVSENNRIGAVITKVTASDADEGKNALIHYFVEPRVANIFSVDSNTGLVKANVKLDREKNASITFIVYARDNGSPKYTSSAVIKVTILDENDEFPTFGQYNYTFTVVEGEDGADSYIGTVTAHDNDINENKKITFAFASRFDHIDMPFTVFPSGEIRTKRPLDREIKDQYTFEIVATDRGVPSRNSSVRVFIKVLDINDNYPQIIYPVGNTTIKISHLSPRNSVVTTIEAHDMDEGKNGALNYKIERSTDVNLFYIDAYSGKMYVSRHIESADIKKYEVYISVSDNGAVPKKTGARIIINVEYTEAAEQLSNGIIGQNVLIAITIACVTVVLSLAIIVTIFLIRRVDTQRKFKGLPNQEAEFQVAETLQLQGKKSCLSKDNPKNPTYEINHFPNGDVKKEVSFSMEDHQSDHRDSGIFMIAQEMPSANHLSTKYSAHIAQQMGHSPPLSNSDSDRSSSPDTHHEELHRMASIRLHQKLLQSYNRPLVYHPDENKQLLLMKKGVEDTRSDGSGEVTTIDSGRGGSVEDIRRPSNGIMI